MMIIFSFSAKPADTSNEKSMFIANHVLTVYENITHHTYVGEERAEILGKINHVVRKGAHFCEYALLACTFALHLIAINKKGLWLFLIPVIFAALYSVTDELHQLIVPGRACRISDMLLDTCGAVTGSLLFRLFHNLTSNSKKKKQVKLQ